MDIGIIGLGAMGSAMARNLVTAGHRVKAWNRSGGQIDGVTMVDAPVEAFQGDAVLTMLSDDAAIRSTLLDTKVLQHAKPGLVHVLTSTISLAFARELVAAHTSARIGYVSAPVLGRPDVAAKGELHVLAAKRGRSRGTRRSTDARGRPPPDGRYGRGGQRRPGLVGDGRVHDCYGEVKGCSA